MNADVDVRFKRLWALQAAVWLTAQIERVIPTRNVLVELACRVVGVESRIDGGPWESCGRVYLSTPDDECDCDCAVCACEMD